MAAVTTEIMHPAQLLRDSVGVLTVVEEAWVYHYLKRILKTISKKKKPER